MLSKNVRIMLLLIVLAMVYTFVLGCGDSAGNAVQGAAKEFSGHVTKSQVEGAIKAIEDSDLGISASAVGAEIKAKYGECNVSHDVYKAVKARCEKMGLGENCTGK